MTLHAAIGEQNHRGLMYEPVSADTGRGQLKT
jgi:hypothetical protein